jgi:hypothetical protein
MIAGLKIVLAASQKDRRDLFVGAGLRLGTVEHNIEKDFWVCWTLDALFNGLQQGGPRLLFKGGTSLSKGYGLIARFSEDIDITVFREDIGEPASTEELESLSGKKRAARLDAIRTACQRFVNGPLRQELEILLRTALEGANLAPDSGRIEPDAHDPDGQSLLLWHPTVTADGSDYIRRAVKIESGILHGLRRWWERRGELRGEGQRVSRHYYDVYRLLASPDGAALVADLPMAEDCVRHARMFFNRPDLDLATAAPGTFALVPNAGMLANLKNDYAAMAGMIFGEVPEFSNIIESISALEDRTNTQQQM